MLRSWAVGLASVFAAIAGQANAQAASVDWNGLYATAGVGYGDWTADTTTQNPTTGACVLCATITQGGNGMFANIGVGYDHVISPHVLIGGFADYTFDDVKGSIQDQGPFFVADAKLDHSWDVGARLGWLMTPTTLTYVDVGYTQANFTSGEARTAFLGVPSGTHYNDLDTDGVFGGVGVEQALWSHWFVRGEWRLANYNTDKFTNCSDTGTCPAAANVTFDPWVQTVNVNAVYKF